MKTTTASKRCILSLSLSVAAALAWAAPALAQHDHGKGQPSDQHAHGDAAKATYFCPMHCEGAKTYAEPGKCPKCGMNLKKQTTDTFSMEIKPLGGVITVGKPATLVFTIKDPTGLPVKKVEVVHEKPLHLLMVSKDLSWYAHEHPELQPDGTFTFTYTFPQAGEFFFFNDFTPPGVGQQVVTVPMTIPGTAPATKALVIDADKPKTIDGYTVTLDTGGPVKTGGEAHLAYTLSKDGKPVTTLAPYLGAMGHLVIISEDRKQFVHSHPHEGGEHAESGQSPSVGGPKVDFEAHFTVPGTYKGWAQFNVGTKEKERVITVPFTFAVAKGEDKDSGHGADGHDHGHARGGALGTATIGAWTVKAFGDITAGKEAEVDIELSGSAEKPAAVRVWIGSQDGKGAMKQKADGGGGDGKEYHAHADVPKPIPADAKLWIEIQDAKGVKSVGGFALKK